MTAEDAALTVRYGHIDQEYATRLATTPPELDGPVWMINLMSYRDRAEYADGRPTTLTGREADDLYAPLGPLTAVGARVVLFADVDQQLLGDRPRWDRVAVVRYPTGRSFLQMQALPEFAGLHQHKDAAMAQTIILAGQPIEVPALPPDAPGWSSVPHPPAPDDQPVVVLHVLRYQPGQYAEMEAYTGEAALVAVPHGVRIDGWFAIEGTIVGDGRSWDQARFNAFPSKAAFMAVVTDQARLAAQHAHREPAIADTYTMILRPVLNVLAGSLAWRQPG